MSAQTTRRDDEVTEVGRSFGTRVWASHRERILYLVVGGWNTLFGYAAFVLLYWSLGSAAPVIVILIFSYCLAVANNYLAYKFIVFRTRGNYIRELSRFVLVYAPGLAANIVVLPIALHVLSWNAYVIQALFTLCVIIVSYFGHKYFTFRGRRDDGAKASPDVIDDSAESSSGRDRSWQRNSSTSRNK